MLPGISIISSLTGLQFHGERALPEHVLPKIFLKWVRTLKKSMSETLFGHLVPPISKKPISSPQRIVFFLPSKFFQNKNFRFSIHLPIPMDLYLSPPSSIPRPHRSAVSREKCAPHMGNIEVIRHQRVKHVWVKNARLQP